MKASFVPSLGRTLDEAAAACGFTGFAWTQVINHWPSPSGLFAQSNRVTPIVVPPGLPFFDPPLGGYSYEHDNLEFWLRSLPHFATAYPFYYSPLDIDSGCAERAPGGVGPCTPIKFGENILNFFDCPKNGCLPGGLLHNNLSVCQGLRGVSDPYMGFRTQLVGYKLCAPSSPNCNADGFMPTAPLFESTWKSDFNGTDAGGVFEVQTASLTPADLSTGTGGVTITSINGVPQLPPGVTCAATPNILWPPNGGSVSVKVSGIMTPGISPLDSGGASYRVIDEYSQVRLSSGITLGVGGTYSFSLPLIAARNKDDSDGRKYTIVVSSKDTIGNHGFCSTVVTVPHDQSR